MERAENTPGWEEAQAETVLSTWVEQYVGMDTKIHSRITAGADAWRKEERVMGDRCRSCKLKRKVLSSCVTLAYMYGLEMMALVEKQ